MLMKSHSYTFTGEAGSKKEQGGKHGEKERRGNFVTIWKSFE